MHQKQSQQQPQTFSPTNVYKLIGKPKQLIEKMSLNKLYSQQWDFPLQPTPLICSVIINSQNGNSGAYKNKWAMELQYRNNAKNGVRKNTKFGKNGVGVALSELEESGALGVLVYERIKRRNWVWQIKASEQIINQVQPNTSSPISFFTNFQSSNLHRVYSQNFQTFYLITQNDTNTQGYNQWFYFSVKCEKQFETIRFQIINLRKKYSCFEKGMKIAIFNQQKYETQKLRWHRGGNNIEYSNNQIKGIRDGLNTLGWDYTFQKIGELVYFAYCYPYTYSDLRHVIKKTKKQYKCAEWSSIGLTPLKNEVYMLKINVRQPQYLEYELQPEQQMSPTITTKSTNLQKKPKNSAHIQESSTKIQEIDGQTIEYNDELNKNSKTSLQNNKKLFQKRNIVLRFNRINNRIGKNREWSFTEALYRQASKTQLEGKNQEIGEDDQNRDRNVSLNKSKKPVKIRVPKKQEEREVLVIMGRAHPGETPSSFVIEGVIDSLLKEESSQMKYLKKKLEIYIIPMLNPDGVIHGNTRTSLTGNDLNRRWSNPHPILHPQNFKIKQFFKELKQSGKSIFAMVDIHAHTRKQSAFFYGCCDKTNYHNHAQVKLLNALFGKADSNFNMLYSSHFVSESKKSTARVTFFREFQCYSYTLENSFYGACDGSYHFSAFDYYNIGTNLLKSLAYFHASTRKKVKNHSINQALLNNLILKKAILDHYERFKQQKNNKEQEQEQMSEGQSKGSSSAPSQNNFKQQFLLQSLFDQPVSDIRYHSRSFNKVGRRNMSLSIQEKPKIRETCTPSQPQKAKKNISQSSKISIGSRKLEMSNKLPLLNFQSKQQQNYEYEFQAFNFKSKKSSSKNWNNNLISNLGNANGIAKVRKLGIGFDYTIQ